MPTALPSMTHIKPTHQILHTLLRFRRRESLELFFEPLVAACSPAVQRSPSPWSIEGYCCVCIIICMSC